MKQNSVDKLLKDFFSIYEEQDPISAMQYAFSTNKYFAQDDKGIRNLVVQLQSILYIIGDYRGYEKLTERSLGNRLKHRTYLVYYDRQPLRFIFEFYQPKDQWFFLHVKFDDKYEEELIKSPPVAHPVSQ